LIHKTQCHKAGHTVPTVW